MCFYAANEYNILWNRAHCYFHVTNCRAGFIVGLPYVQEGFEAAKQLEKRMNNSLQIILFHELDLATNYYTWSNWQNLQWLNYMPAWTWVLTSRNRENGVMVGSHVGIECREFISADVSVMALPVLFNFIIENNFYWINVSRKQLIGF